MKRILVLIPVTAALGLFVAGGVLMSQGRLSILNPKGSIALEERNLMVAATLLMLIVVIPVLVLTFAIAWKYREGNKKAKYAPDWDHHNLTEFTWWAVPSIIILVLAVITWTSSHKLDPYKPLAHDAKPLTVQVVALQWKWLFIYPEQKIATVNYVKFPKDRPINFEITSDAPMNSFWIPQLGGQIYAMPGMSTKLHLMASEVGEYAGSSANLSGAGFAGMRFTASATSQDEFDRWARQVQDTQKVLDTEAYRALAKPSQNQPVADYSFPEDDLYNKVVMQYMSPEAAIK